jgi:hypothetical protein
VLKYGASSDRSRGLGWKVPAGWPASDIATSESRFGLVICDRFQSGALTSQVSSHCTGNAQFTQVDRGTLINKEIIMYLVHENNQLVHENNQLKKHWRGVGTMQLAMCLDHIENNVRRNRPDLVNHYVRQFHNVLGYRAMGELRYGGLCAGALYRSEEFVSIPQDSRNGAARLGNVHIEHTVPVNVIVSAIFSRYSTTLQFSRAAAIGLPVRSTTFS